MIGDFISSWPLFHSAYLTGWLMSAALAAIGVLFVARDQIFVGVAVSQASTLGIALALYAAGILGMDTHAAGAGNLASVAGIAFAVAASLVTLSGGRPGGDSHESVTGWVYLLSLSGSILVIAKSPLGLNEVYRLLSSSIIAADAPDVWLFGSIAAVVVAAGVVFRNSLSLLVIDPAFASAAGLRAPVWWTVIAAASGAVIGVSIAAAGALYAFGCLVLPGLIAKNLSRNTAPIFIAAPLIAVFFGVFGFAAANSMDLPPAQVTVLLMCFGLAFAWLYRRGHY